MSTFNPKDQEVIEPQKNSFGVSDQPVDPRIPQDKGVLGPISATPKPINQGTSAISGPHLSKPQIEPKPERPVLGNAEDYFKSHFVKSSFKTPFSLFGSIRRPTDFNNRGRMQQESIKFRKALKIAQSDSADTRKIAELSKLFPNAKFSHDGRSRIMEIGTRKMRIFTPGDEGYKELKLPFFANSDDPTTNPRFANTPQGKLNALKNLLQSPPYNVKNISQYVGVSKDIYNNPLLIVKKSVLGMKPGNYYFNKPGFSIGDFQDGTKPFLQENVLPTTTSAVLGGARPLMAIAGTMLSAGANTALIEKQKEVGGVEKFDPNYVKRVAVAWGLGEAGGRLLAKYMTKIFSRAKTVSKKNILNDNGQLSDDFIKTLHDQGMTKDQFFNQIKKELKLTKDKAKLFDDFVDATGDFPTMGQLSGHSRDKAVEMGIAGQAGGDKLQNKLLMQDQNMFGKLDDFQTRTGGNLSKFVDDSSFNNMPQSKIEVGSGLREALKATEKAEAKAANSILQDPNILASANVQLDKQTFLNSVQTTLNNHKIVLKKEAGDLFKQLKAIQKSDQPLTFNQAKELDETIRLYQGGQNKALNKALREIKDATRTAMDTATTNTTKAGEIFKEGMKERAKVRGDFDANDVITQILKKKSSSEYTVKTQDIYNKLVVNGEPDTLEKAITILNRSKQGQQAVGNMKQHAIKEIIEIAKGSKVAVKTVGEKEFYSFSGTKLKSFLQKNGHKYKVLFKDDPDILSELTKLAKAGEAKSISSRYTPQTIKGGWMMNLADAVGRKWWGWGWGPFASGPLKMVGKEQLSKKVGKAASKAMMEKQIKKIGKKAMKRADIRKQLKLPRAVSPVAGSSDDSKKLAEILGF